MFEEYEKRKRNQVSLMKSLMDYGMGLLILLTGFVFLFRDRIDIVTLNEKLGKPDLTEKLFGGICIVYGLWRIYRGYRKNYLR